MEPGSPEPETDAPRVPAGERDSPEDIGEMGEAGLPLGWEGVPVIV